MAVATCVAIIRSVQCLTLVFVALLNRPCVSLCLASLVASYSSDVASIVVVESTRPTVSNLVGVCAVPQLGLFTGRR
jgi:hypothetical protein